LCLGVIAGELSVKCVCTSGASPQKMRLKTFRTYAAMPAQSPTGSTSKLQTLTARER